MISEAQKKLIFKILDQYDPIKIWVFGSYARGENKGDSDLDLMVNLGKRINLLDLIGIEQELSMRAADLPSAQGTCDTSSRTLARNLLYSWDFRA